MEAVERDIKVLVDDWIASGFLEKDMLLLIGCSTSEVIGEEIGTFGSEDVAKILYGELERLTDYGLHLVFQCCEHLNRALVLEKSVAQACGYEEVSVVPQKDAGGSMATYAYNQMKDPVVVEEVAAHLGIDIGDTFIGMHLKKVAVPVRFQVNHIGAARLTAARTRPKLIGGARAKYE